MIPGKLPDDPLGRAGTLQREIKHELPASAVSFGSRMSD
jgi:hypothetical protein